MKAKPTDLDLQILKKSSLKNFFFDKHIRQLKKGGIPRKISRKCYKCLCNQFVRYDSKMQKRI